MIPRTGEPEPLAVECPWCGAREGKPCQKRGVPTKGPHPERTLLAKMRRAWKTGTYCACRNHLGRPKSGYSSAATALAWAARCKRTAGMRMEPYQCPTSSAWHIRTALNLPTRTGPPR